MMKSIKRRIDAIWSVFAKIIHTIEGRTLSLGSFFAAFGAIVIIRLAQQWWIHGFVPDTFSGQFVVLAETVLVFLAVILSITLLWGAILHIKVTRVVPVVLSGMLITLIAPLFDIFRRDIDFTYYEITDLQGLIMSFLTVIGQTPHVGITIGYRLEIVLAVVFSVLYAFIHTRAWHRLIGVALGTYSIFFIVATFPSIIGLLVHGITKKFSTVTHIDSATLFLTPHDVLVHIVPSSLHAFFFHISLIYVFIVAVLALLFFWYFERLSWYVMWRTMHYHVIFMYVQAFIIGSALMMMFQGVSLQALIGGEFFSSIALGITLLSVLLYGIAFSPLSREVQSIQWFTPLRWILAGSAVFISTLIHEKIAFFMIIAIAVYIVQYSKPLELGHVPILKHIITAITLLLFVFVGATVVSLDINIISSTSLTWYLLFIFFALSVTYEKMTCCLIFSQSQLYKTLAILGILWFLVFVSGVIVFNIYNLVFFALMCSIVVFVIMWRWLFIQQKQSQSTFFYLQCTMIVYACIVYSALT